MRGSTVRSASSGSVNTTAIGSTCVMTTSPVLVLALTTLPGVDEPKADSPADGCGDPRIRQVQPSAVDRGLVNLESGLELRHGGELGIDVLPGDRVLAEKRLVATRGPPSHWRVAPDRAPTGPAPAPVAPGTAEDRSRRADLRALTNCPSRNSTRISCPSTRGRTVTVLKAATDPSAVRRTGTSARVAAAVATGKPAGATRRAGVAAVRIDV